jgi:uncharacterized membrane protein
MTRSNDPLSRNIESIAELERQSLQQLSRLDRVSHVITRVAGSGAFIVGHLVWFVTWVVINRGTSGFDLYPYNLLNLLVALEAIVLTSFVLMTQNRMTKQADRRAHVDLQVNLLAEQELTAILQMVYALCQHAGTCARINDNRIDQLLQETDVIRLAVAVEKELVTLDEEEDGTESR